MANTGKFLGLNAGVIQEELALQVSTGATDAGKIIRTDGAGLLPVSMLPVGVGAETITVTTSEAITAGALVNIWNSTGLKARNADNTTAGKEAVGFVLAGFASGAVATVYLPSQTNTSATGRTIGAKQFLGAAGAMVETPPTASGAVVQQVGFAYAATGVLFQPLQAITLA